MATYDEVRAAVERNEVDTALAALETLAAEKHHFAHEVSLHRAQWTRLAQQQRQSLLSPADADAALQRLLAALLQCAQAIANDRTPSSRREAQPPSSVAEDRSPWSAAPAPAAAPVASAGKSVAALTDAATWLRAFREALSSLYGRVDDAMRLAADANMPRARIDFTGSAQTVWLRVLDEAAKGGHLVALMRAAREEYPQNPELERLERALAAAPIPAAVTWTPQTLLDALQRLLVPQFEELLFRLVVPTHYLPPATATMAERAIALVRMCEQSGRTAELGAAIERLGVRPRG